MTDLDDIYDEMRLHGKTSERDLERVLSGDETDDVAMEELASAFLSARDHLTGLPDEETRRSHLVAMAAAIEDVESEGFQNAESPAKSRPTFGRRLMRRTLLIGTRAAAAGGVLALSSFGLAYAGVDLPGTAAEQAWQMVGVHLPNQADLPEQARAGDVHDVIESSEERGCEFGQAVADAASDGKSDQDPAKDACTAGDSDAETKGSRATGDENSVEGRAKAAEKSDGRSEAGADNAGTNDDAGRATASEKSGGTSDAGRGNAGTGGDAGTTGGRDNAGSNDDIGEDTASDGSGNADQGKETASEKSGGAKPDTPSGP
jgi:hypothetical protein